MSITFNTLVTLLRRSAFTMCPSYAGHYCKLIAENSGSELYSTVASAAVSVSRERASSQTVTAVVTTAAHSSVPSSAGSLLNAAASCCALSRECEDQAHAANAAAAAAAKLEAATRGSAWPGHCLAAAARRQ
jgi:hypothetical protein